MIKLILLLSDTSASVVKSGKLVHIDLIIICYHYKMLRGYIPPVQYHIKCDNLQLSVQSMRDTYRDTVTCYQGISVCVFGFKKGAHR